MRVDPKSPPDRSPGADTRGNCPAEFAEPRRQLREDLRTRLEHSRQFRLKHKRPFIIVSYAQSVDGSIGSRTREQLRLSGLQSMTLTHSIRACCDAILIGSGTLLADDPQLTVRLVQGRNPQPIVLDTRLRTPPGARLLQRSDCSPWIINGSQSPDERVRRLEQAGATLLSCATGEDARIDLRGLMTLLYQKNINSVMVEGGAQVITSFINFKLMDQLIITVAPKMVGGLQVIDAERLKLSSRFRLRDADYQLLGEDLVIWARPSWGSQ